MNDMLRIRVIRSTVGVLALLAPAVRDSAAADSSAAHSAAGAGTAARWIWARPDEPAPKNRFTYFRRVVKLDAIPKDATLRIAADSNAAMWINGHVVCRKVPRYHEPRITALPVNVGPYLRVGENVVVVRHHNWGGIITFQRTGNTRAGLWIRSPWLVSDTSWRCTTAHDIAIHDQQIVGVIGDKRIRYPQIIDGEKGFPGGSVHDPDFMDGGWDRAIEVTDGPWPEIPEDVETPPQREYAVEPLAVLAAGRLERTPPISDEPLSIAAGIRTARCIPDEDAARAAGDVLRGMPVTVSGKAGESCYITFDFGRPVHGFPFVGLEGATAGARIDFGYGELARSLYDGELHVRPDGWLNPERVVGPGYADRYITRTGPQTVDLPDERTARWLSLHIHFPTDGRVILRRVGIVKSQYPVDLAGSFSCGDERIDQIVKLYLIHAEVTMSDSYVDTPGREDGQWIEDAQPRALLAATWFGDARLRAFLLRTFGQGQGPDGDFHPFFPSNYPAYPAPYDWGVQYVAFLYDQYVWTGDKECIRRHWDTMKRYWANLLARVGDDGIWRTDRVLADIRVGVRCENGKQSSGIVTPWVIERLRWSVEMAEAIGETQQAAAWKGVCDRMTAAFRKHHLVPGAGKVPLHVADRLDPENPGKERGYSQAGQTIAVTAGLLTREEALADLQYAFPPPHGSPPSGVTRWNNPTYGYRVLRALSDVGLTERAVAHLIERYSPYLPGHPGNPTPAKLQGPYGGPLPEYWVSREDLGLRPGEKNSAQPADETGSHGWGAVPLLWLHDSLLGVRVTQPGGGAIRIAPDAGGLAYVAGHVVTPKGLVWVRWDTQSWALDVDVPQGVTAEIRIPTACAGKRIRATKTAGEAETAGDDVFRVRTGGRYSFVAE